MGQQQADDGCARQCACNGHDGEEDKSRVERAEVFQCLGIVADADAHAGHQCAEGVEADVAARLCRQDMEQAADDSQNEKDDNDKAAFQGLQVAAALCRIGRSLLLCFLCLLSMCHNSLAAVTLPSVPPIVSRMASSPMVCRPCMISLLPPTSTPSRKSNSQMRMVMKRWMPFKRCLRSRKPATIPVSMSPMTVNIFYYSFEKRGKDSYFLVAYLYLCNS